MKNISFRKLTLSILALIIIGVGLTGCAPDLIPTGSAKIILSGSYYYNIKMDEVTQWESRPSGTYTLTGILPGYHTFEAVDVDGKSYGYDSKTVYISAGTTSTIYLNPKKQTSSYGIAKIIVSGDYFYDIKMDDYTYFYDKQPGTYTLTDITEGYHTFEAVDVDGKSFGYDSKTVYISAGTTTTVNLKPSSPSTGIGSLEVTIMDDPGYKYYVYLGTSSSGKYLGTTSGSNTYNSLIAHNIPTGNQNIYVISTDGIFSKVSPVYINPNMTNILNIWI